MGWNSITIVREAPPLRGLASGEHFYFLHSYYVEPLDESVIATVSTYGLTFVSSIWYENVFACQFHPEKSQGAGLRLIRNFGLWRT
jgi:glutamine amidotransferase